MAFSEQSRNKALIHTFEDTKIPRMKNLIDQVKIESHAQSVCMLRIPLRLSGYLRTIPKVLHWDPGQTERKGEGKQNKSVERESLFRSHSRKGYSLAIQLFHTGSMSPPRSFPYSIRQDTLTDQQLNKYKNEVCRLQTNNYNRPMYLHTFWKQFANSGNRLGVNVPPNRPVPSSKPSINKSRCGIVGCGRRDRRVIQLDELVSLPAVVVLSSVRSCPQSPEKNVPFSIHVFASSNKETTP
ncbi:hypothetical protein J6590_039883 [Homalodisca vitripennis]|nr:hypothetical protein J6590_039883 [Homalodisca vitripennis]